MTITYMKCKVYTWAMWMSLVVSERLSAGPILGIPPIIVLAKVRRTNTRLQSARTQASAIKIPEQKAFWNGMKFRHAFISLPWCTCVLNGPIPFLNFPRLSVNIINNKKTRGKNALTDWCVVLLWMQRREDDGSHSKKTHYFPAQKTSSSTSYFRWIFPFLRGIKWKWMHFFQLGSSNEKLLWL